MTWSDAVRVEADFREEAAAADPSRGSQRLATPERALWRERSLAWFFRLDPDVRIEDAEKIVADLSAASRPL